MGKRVKAALAGYAARAASGDPQAVADYQATMASYNAKRATKKGGLFGHMLTKYNPKNLKNSIMNPKNLIQDIGTTFKEGLHGSFKDKRANLRAHHNKMLHPFDSSSQDVITSDPAVVARGVALRKAVDKASYRSSKSGAISGILFGVGSYLGKAAQAANAAKAGATVEGAGQGALQTAGQAGSSVLDQTGSQLLTQGTEGLGQGALQTAGNAAVSAAPSLTNQATTQAPSLMSKVASGAKDLASNKLLQTAALTAIGGQKNKPSAAEQALINQQAAAAAQAGAVGSGLLDQYKSGTLNAADQAQIDQYKQQALASTDQYLASAGLSDSSAGVEMRNKIEQNATVLYGQFRDQTLQQGLQALGVGTGGSGAAQLLQTLMQRDTNARNAWAGAAQTYMQLSALSA